MTETLRTYRDDGPLAELVGLVGRVGRGRTSSASRLGWLVPPLLRAVEYGAVIWLAWRAPGTVLPVAYALLAALAFHHYDVVYRMRQLGTPPPRWLGRLGGGWDVRLLVLLAAAWLGALLPVMALMAAWTALLFVSESVASWVAVARDEHRTVLATDEEDDE